MCAICWSAWCIEGNRPKFKDGRSIEGIPHSLLAFRTKSPVADPPRVTLAFNENRLAFGKDLRLHRRSITVGKGSECRMIPHCLLSARDEEARLYSQPVSMDIRTSSCDPNSCRQKC